MKQKCNHPGIRPTEWNQSRPAPAEVNTTCKCGARWVCPVCGWGEGGYPCKCEIDRDKNKFADLTHVKWVMEHNRQFTNSQI